MDLFSLLYYNTVDNKGYDKVENNWPSTHEILFVIGPAIFDHVSANYATLYFR